MKKILNILLITGLFFITSCEKEKQIVIEDEQPMYVIEVVNLTTKPMNIRIDGRNIENPPYIIFGDSVRFYVRHSNVTPVDTYELSRFEVYINGKFAKRVECNCVQSWFWYSGTPF